MSLTFELYNPTNNSTYDITDSITVLQYNPLSNMVPYRPWNYYYLTYDSLSSLFDEYGTNTIKVTTNGTMQNIITAYIFGSGGFGGQGSINSTTGSTINYGGGGGAGPTCYMNSSPANNYSCVFNMYANGVASTTVDFGNSSGPVTINAGSNGVNGGNGVDGGGNGGNGGSMYVNNVLIPGTGPCGTGGVINEYVNGVCTSSVPMNQGSQTSTSQAANDEYDTIVNNTFLFSYYTKMSFVDNSDSTDVYTISSGYGGNSMSSNYKSTCNGTAGSTAQALFMYPV
jgi:hypothetical protein